MTFTPTRLARLVTVIAVVSHVLATVLLALALALRARESRGGSHTEGTKSPAHPELDWMTWTRGNGLPAPMMNAAIKRTISHLVGVRSRYSSESGDLPEDVYRAYLLVFRDAGIRVVESDKLDDLNALLLGSPAGVTLIIDRSLSKRSKVHHCAHALAHVVLGHGRGKAWFLLEDPRNELETSRESRSLNNDAGMLADAMLNGEDISWHRKTAAFRGALRLGASRPFIRGMLDRLQQLHHLAQRRAPRVNQTLKSNALSRALWASGRAVKTEVDRLTAHHSA